MLPAFGTTPTGPKAAGHPSSFNRGAIVAAAWSVCGRSSSAGADVNVTNHKGQTALHCAAKAGFVDIVTLLLAHGATVDAVDDKGETPLATALRSTAKDKACLMAVVGELLAAGADPHRADRQGRTPADVASRKRDRRWASALGIGQEPSAGEASPTADA